MKKRVALVCCCLAVSLICQAQASDAYEIDLPTRIIRLLTAHYPHPGYTRALTYFSDYAGYKASNPVVSDDARF